MIKQAVQFHVFLGTNVKIGHYLTVKLDIVDYNCKVLNLSLVLPSTTLDDDLFKLPSLNVLIPGMRITCVVKSVSRKFMPIWGILLAVCLILFPSIRGDASNSMATTHLVSHVTVICVWFHYV